MEIPELNFTLKLTAEMINAIAYKVAEIQKPMARSDIETTYTVLEVSRIVGKKPATITKHIRIKLLKAEKTGKSYTITENNLNNYINAK